MKTQKELLSLQNESEYTKQYSSNYSEENEQTGIIEIGEHIPFNAYRNNTEEEWMIVCGNKQATPKTFKTIEEIKQYTKGQQSEIPWELITSIVITIAENINEMKKQIEEQKIEPEI